jgi:predicted DNA-binding WGR domain protein
MNEQYFALLKTSDGSRGENGKQKIYEIRIQGRKVVYSWGMAEKANRQSKTVYFANDNVAQFEALNQLRSKVVGGYRVAVRA